MPNDESMKIEGETCPVCSKKTLTLSETSLEVPYFGKLFVFSMSCSSCNYHKADLEAAEQKKPVKYTFDVTSKEDLSVRVVKSSEATVKVPHVGTITPGAASEGYVTNVEGILERLKKQVEAIKNMEDEPAAKKKAKNLLKKMHKIMAGNQPVKIIIEDPSGNSAIISDKAVKSALKK